MKYAFSIFYSHKTSSWKCLRLQVCEACDLTSQVDLITLRSWAQKPCRPPFKRRPSYSIYHWLPGSSQPIKSLLATLVSYKLPTPHIKGYHHPTHTVYHHPIIPYTTILLIPYTTILLIPYTTILSYRIPPSYHTIYHINIIKPIINK